MDFSLATPLERTTSATISPGQTATYNFVVVSAGYSGTISLARCSGLPAETSSTVLSSTTTLGQNSTVPLQVTISTTAPSASSPRVPIASLRSGTNRTDLILLAAALFGMLPAFKFRCARPSRRRSSTTNLAPRRLVTSLILALLIASCGGTNNFPPANDPGTSTGTYAIILTGTTQNTSRTCS